MSFVLTECVCVHLDDFKTFTHKLVARMRWQILGHFRTFRVVEAVTRQQLHVSILQSDVIYSLFLKLLYFSI